MWCMAVCGVWLGCNKICAHYSNTMILFGCTTNDYSVLILAYLVISYFNSSMNYHACISSLNLALCLFVNSLFKLLDYSLGLASLKIRSSLKYVISNYVML